MFNVDTNSGIVSLSTGDTGPIPFRASGYDLSDLNYKFVFSAKAKGQIVKEEYYMLDADGRFVVEMVNADTDQIGPVTAFYDVTIVVDPIYDAAGKIVDGSYVRTLIKPTRMTIRPAVRKI